MLNSAQSSRYSSNTSSGRFLERYGANIVSGGIAAIPTALFLYQRELDLTPQEIWFVSAILSYKWNTDLPHPSLKKMAERSGVSEQQLHGYKGQLIKKGYLVIITRYDRWGGQAPNAYNFAPLFDHLERYLARDSQDNKQVYACNEEGLNQSLEGGLNPGLDKEEIKQEEIISNIRQEKPEEKSLKVIYEENTLVIEEGPSGVCYERSPYAKQVIPSQTRSSGFTSISDTIAMRQVGERGSPERDAILSRIEQFAHEFEDKASLKSSTSRAYNLLKQSNLNQEAFINCLWEARAITREPGRHITSKMGYFFSVLAERAGVV